ncbi:hypothetical protein HC928_07645 [bacterium]|nr:hypothetical protein [bacterium]
MTKLEWLGKHLIILVLTIGLIVFPVAPSFAAVTDLTGGPGGQPFSDEGLLAPDRSISEIAIQYDRYLTAIGAVATDASGTRVELPTMAKVGDL